MSGGTFDFNGKSESFSRLVGVGTVTISAGKLVQLDARTGTLVPDEIRWIPAMASGRVERIVLRPGEDAASPEERALASTLLARRRRTHDERAFRDDPSPSSKNVWQ